MKLQHSLSQQYHQENFINFLKENFNSLSPHEQFEQFKIYIEKFYLDKNIKTQDTWISKDFKETYLSQFFSRFLTTTDLQSLTQGGKIKEAHQFLMGLDLLYFYSHPDANLRINNQIHFYQDEYYKKNLLNGEFDKIPEFHILELYKTHKNLPKNASPRAHALSEKSMEMINYFLNNDIKKLRLLANFFNKFRELPGEKDIIQSSQILYGTSMQDLMFFNYLNKYEEQSTQYPHKDIKVFNLIDENLKNYLFNSQKSWDKLPDNKKIYLFSRVFLLNYQNFTQEEENLFSSLFVKTLDNIQKNIGKEGYYTQPLFSPENITMPLLLKYSPEHIGMFIENNVLGFLDNNFRNIRSNFNNKGDVEIPIDEHSILFKSLDFHFHSYKDTWWRKFLAETYQPHIIETGLLDTSLIHDSNVVHINNSLQKIKENFSTIYQNPQRHDVSYGEFKYTELFLPLLFTTAYNKKETVEDYKFLHQVSLLTLFQRYLSKDRSFSDIVYQDSFELFSELLIDDIYNSPIEILHQLADEYHHIANHLNHAQSVENCSDFVKNMSRLLSHKGQVDYKLGFDTILSLMEEQILDNIVPVSSKPTKTLKF